MLFRTFPSFAIYTGLLSLASAYLPEPPSTATSHATPTDTIDSPTPIQSGMIRNCDSFHLVKNGDTCIDIAKSYRISPDQFHAWNPAVGEACDALWANYYVCVSVVSIAPRTLKTTTKPTTTSVFIPPACSFNVSKGEYICPTPAKAVTTSFSIPPVCSFNVSKGEYICPATAKATTTSFVIPPVCSFDVSKGEYICPAPTKAAT